MLAVLGSGLIGGALLALLALILASRAGRWRWLGRPEVAERIATGLIAGAIAVIIFGATFLAAGLYLD